MTIRNIVFDFGHVLLHWDQNRALCSRYTQASIDWFFNDPESGFAVANAACDRDKNRTWALEYLRKEYSERSYRMMKDYLDHVEQTLTPMPGALDLVRDIKETGIHMFGLTNWPAEEIYLAKQYPAIQYMEDIVVSGEENVAKPDPAIFNIAIQRFGIQPAETLFIDDKAENVEAAREIGFQGIVHTGNPQLLRTRLIELGVDIPELQ